MNKRKGPVITKKVNLIWSQRLFPVQYWFSFIVLLCGNLWATPVVEHQTVTGVSGEFEVAMEERSRAGGVVRFHVSFPSPIESQYPENNTVVGELYLPDGQQQTGEPVVLLHILNGNFEVESLIAQELARAGSPAFWFKLPYYGERRPAEWKTSRPVTMEGLFQMLGQGLADFRRACDLMTANYSDQANQVNLVGVSMGGILAYDFAVQEPRVRKICTVMAGGDLWGIIHHARETRQLRAAIAQLDEESRLRVQKRLELRDPLHAASTLRVRATAGEILMINAAEDEVIPRQNAERLARVLGLPEDHLQWVEHVGHYSIVAKIDEVIGRIVGFLAIPVREDSFADADIQKPKGAESLLADFLYKIGMMLDPSAPVSYGQHLQFRVHWHGPNQAEQTGSFSWKRNASGQFVFKSEESYFGEIRIGQSAYPWIYLGRESMLITGEKGKEQSGWMAKISPSVRLRIQLLANMFKFGARVPGILQAQGTLSHEEKDGMIQVRYTAKKIPLSIDLRYHRGRDQYESCLLHFSGHSPIRLEIQTLEDRVTFTDDEFVAPSVAHPLQVRTEDIQHTLSLLLEVVNGRVGKR